MGSKRVRTLLLLCVFGAVLARCQQFRDFKTPRPMPSGSVLVIGFLGGFERWTDENRSVNKVAAHLKGLGLTNVFVETASNHRRGAAMKLIRKALDSNRNGKTDPEEAAAAKIILYGQSWGGGAVVKTARDLNKKGVPVLLSVQVDSVGLKDNVIPPNVHAAANFFQHDLLTIWGEPEIRAADPSRTRILGNQQFSYYFRPSDPSQTWARRHLGGAHAKMESDPLVWSQVELLILNAIH